MASPHVAPIVPPRWRAMFACILAAAWACARAGDGGSATGSGLGRLAFGQVAPGVVPTPEARTLAADSARGGLALFRIVAEEPGNIVVSPYAVQAAMGMMYLGAQGQTAEAMRQAMGWSQEPRVWGPAWANLASVMATGADAAPDLELATASRLFLAAGAEVLPAYQAALSEAFATGSLQLPFADDAEGSRRAINQWAEEQTAGRIQGLLPAGTIDTGTQLVQTAALRLKARWRSPMVQDSAASLTFVGDDGQARQLRPLQVTTTLPYLDAGDYRAAALPYAGSSLAMVVMRPEGEVDALAASLDGNRLAATCEQMQPEHLEVSLPAFDFFHDADLTAALARLGLGVAATGEAQFALLRDTSVAVAGIFEQAHIAIDEEGTEAEAAAAVVGEATSAPQPQASTPLIFDRPFLFFVVDRSVDAVLFVGRVSSP